MTDDAGGSLLSNGYHAMQTLARLVSVVLLSLAGHPANAGAQHDSTASPSQRNWIAGGTAMFPGGMRSADASVLGLGITATSARPNRIGPDFAVVAFPRGLQAGALVGGIRANIGIPITLGPNVTVVPSAGVSLVGAIGVIGGGGLAGWNSSVSLLLFATPRTDAASSTGLRIAMAGHQFFGAGEGVRFLEVGFVRR